MHRTSTAPSCPSTAAERPCDRRAWARLSDRDAAEASHAVGEGQPEGSADDDSQHAARKVAVSDPGADSAGHCQSEQHSHERHRHPPARRREQDREQRQQGADGEREGGGGRCLDGVGQIGDFRGRCFGGVRRQLRSQAVQLTADRHVLAERHRHGPGRGRCDRGPMPAGWLPRRPAATQAKSRGPAGPRPCAGLPWWRSRRCPGRIAGRRPAPDRTGVRSGRTRNPGPCRRS
jgi:hypothetical protein